MFEDDILEENTYCETPGAVLAGLDWDSRKDFGHSMYEMTALIEACGMKVVDVMTQKLSHPEAGTYLGKGKAEELAALTEICGASYCIFEGNLSPAQLKNLQNMIKVPIWDKTTLILEIFSRRARTREARLQVESAYLQYMLPRLSGMWQHLGRQAGASGSRSSRGIGETQLELDRRQIKNRITELSRELEVLDRTRSVQSQGRKKNGLPQAALVGYTNAGKSTIMNRLLPEDGDAAEKKVFEEDMLFATLDTSIRRIRSGDNRDFLLSDTVGFIEDLPAGLIKAFRSTLREAASADILLIVLDASDPYRDVHKSVTEETLKDLGAEKIPKIYVMNKSDLIPERSWSIPRIKNDEIWISAKNGTGLEELVKMITDRLYEDNRTVTVLLPYKRGDILDRIHRQGRVISEEYTAEGILIRADCPAQLAGELDKLP